jgi:hypothetical protein
MTKMLLAALTAIGVALPLEAQTLTKAMPVEAAQHHPHRTSVGSVFKCRAIETLALDDTRCGLERMRHT